MNPKAAVLLLLPTLACAVGPNYVKPEIPVPKAWNEGRATQAAPSAASLQSWWTEFRDPTLDRLVNEAVAGNLDLKLAAARIREARAARGIAASAGLPQLGANAAYARTHNSPLRPGDRRRVRSRIRRELGDRRLRRRAERQGGRARRRPGGRRRPTRGPGHAPGRRRPQLPRAAWNTATAPHPGGDAGRGAGHPRHRDGAARSRSRRRARRRPRRRPPESQRSRPPRPGAPDPRGDLPPGRPRRKRAGRPRDGARNPERHPARPPGDPPDAALRAPLQAPGPEARRARARRRHRPHRRRPRGSLPPILDPRQLRTTHRKHRRLREGRRRVLERRSGRSLADLRGRKNPRQHRGAGRPPGASPAPVREADPHRPGRGRDRPLRPHARALTRSFLEGRRRLHPPRPGPGHGPLHERSRELPLRPRRRALGLRRGGPAGP